VALPADSVRPGSLPAVRAAARRSAMWGRYRPCTFWWASVAVLISGCIRLEGACLLDRSCWPGRWSRHQGLRPRLACAGSGPLVRAGSGERW